MKRLLSSLCCVALLLCACSVGSSSVENGAEPASSAHATTATAAVTEPPTEPLTEPLTEAPTEPTTPEELARERLDGILSGELSKTSASVDVPALLQYPDLPTGCETVALTIALNACGCGVTAVEFASQYLLIGDDIIRSFVGDPFAWGGAGIYPPGLAASAERYFDASGAALTAFDLTGTSLDDLYKLLAAGYPVVVWTTYYLSSPSFIGGPYTYDGHTVYWYENEHCVCLFGYDAEQGVVLISDPLQGKVKWDADEFESVYDEIGRMALVIIRNAD